jgi:hypothetical protein
MLRATILDKRKAKLFKATYQALRPFSSRGQFRQTSNAVEEA